MFLLLNYQQHLRLAIYQNNKHNLLHFVSNPPTLKIYAL